MLCVYFRPTFHSRIADEQLFWTRFRPSSLFRIADELLLHVLFRPTIPFQKTDEDLFFDRLHPRSVIGRTSPAKVDINSPFLFIFTRGYLVNVPYMILQANNRQIPKGIVVYNINIII